MTTAELKQGIMEAMKMDTDTLTLKEASKVLKMGVNQVVECARYRGLPFSKIGNKYRFSKELITNWHRNQCLKTN